MSSNRFTPGGCCCDKPSICTRTQGFAITLNTLDITRKYRENQYDQFVNLQYSEGDPTDLVTPRSPARFPTPLPRQAIWDGTECVIGDTLQVNFDWEPAPDANDLPFVSLYGLPPYGYFDGSLEVSLRWVDPSSYYFSARVRAYELVRGAVWIRSNINGFTPWSLSSTIRYDGQPIEANDPINSDALGVGSFAGTYHSWVRHSGDITDLPTPPYTIPFSLTEYSIEYEFEIELL